MKTLTASSVSVSGSGVTVVFAISEQTFTQPAQQKTIGEYPSGNANFSRGHRVTDQAHFVERLTASGMASLAFLLNEAISAVAIAVESGLTWTPIFTVQPTSHSVATASATSFTVTVTVENSASITYQWQLSADGGGTWSAVAESSPYSDTQTNTLLISDSTGLDAVQYRCVATNASGDTTSNAALLTVT